MIEPLDFSKYDQHNYLYLNNPNYEEAIAEWHRMNDFIIKKFKADLVVYLIDYLSIELGEESIYLPKIIKLVEIAMDYVEEYDGVLNLCVRMLPLLRADKL